MSDNDVLVFPAPGPIPANAVTSTDGGDIGKERELRVLRAQVESLQQQLDEASKTIHAPLTARMSYEEPKHRPSTCGYHPSIEVSMDTASCSCRVCGEEIAPLDVLREYARHERQFVSGLEHLRKESAQLVAEVDRLKKQRSSLRSQIRKKGGTVPDDPNCTRPTAQQYYKLHAQLVKVTMELEDMKRKAGAK